MIWNSHLIKYGADDHELNGFEKQPQTYGMMMYGHS